MKHLMLILSILFSLNFYSQQKNYEINYISKVKSPNGEISQFDFTLLESNDNSLFVFNEATAQFSSDMYNKSNKNEGLFYDKLNDIFYYRAEIFTKNFFIKDELVKQDWKITNNYKNILNIKCREAIVSFRGRDYIAYFSEEIVIPSGPWKFKKLPGLILSVHSTDNSFSYVATSIKELEKLDIINPYSKLTESDYVTFKEYKEKMKIALERLEKKLRTEEKEDFEYNITDNSIELTY